MAHCRHARTFNKVQPSFVSRVDKNCCLKQPDAGGIAVGARWAKGHVCLVNGHPVRCHMMEDGRDCSLEKLLILVVCGLCNPEGNASSRFVMIGAIGNPGQLHWASSDSS